MPLQYKHCSTCGGGPWPPHRFYKMAKRKDGSYRYSPNCKVCYRLAVRENADLKAEHYKPKKAERAKRPEYVEARKRYRESEHGKKVMREARIAWTVLHPEQYREIQQRSWKNQSIRRKAKRAAAKAALSQQHHHRGNYERARRRDESIVATPAGEANIQR